MAYCKPGIVSRINPSTACTMGRRRGITLFRIHSSSSAWSSVGTGGFRAALVPRVIPFGLISHGIVSGPRGSSLSDESRRKRQCLPERLADAFAGSIITFHPRSEKGDSSMPRYLISFDDGSMDHIREEDLPTVGEASHAVVREIKQAGAWIFGGGVLRQQASIVATDGSVADGPVPETKA